MNSSLLCATPVATQAILCSFLSGQLQELTNSKALYVNIHHLQALEALTLVGLRDSLTMDVLLDAATALEMESTEDASAGSRAQALLQQLDRLAQGLIACLVWLRHGELSPASDVLMLRPDPVQCYVQFRSDKDAHC